MKCSKSRLTSSICSELHPISKNMQNGLVFAILLSGIGGASGYVAPMIIQRALDLAIPEKKREAFIFSCGNAGRHLSGERDLHNNPKPHYGGCQSEYHL